MGEEGTGRATESGIYKSVAGVYAKLEERFRSDGFSYRPEPHMVNEERKKTESIYRAEFGNSMIFEGIREISAGSPPHPPPTIAPWAFRASDMCLRMGDALRDSLVSGAVYAYYLDYMAPDTGDAPRVFARDIIRRSCIVGNSTPLHPMLGKYESIASGGYCPMFAALSLFEGGVSTRMLASLRRGDSGYVTPRPESIARTISKA